MSTVIPSRARAIAAVTLSACCFGAISIFTIVATGRGMPLASVLAGRYLLAVVMFLGVIGRSPADNGMSSVRLPVSRAARIMVLAGGGQALVAFLGLSALRYLPAATAAFLFYTYPAWVAVFAAVRGTEHLDPRRLGALALSLAGVGLMVGRPTAANAPGVLLALSAAVGFALYIPLIGRLQHGIAASVTSVYLSAAAGTIFLIAAALTGTLALPPDPVALGAVVGLAFVSTTVAFILFLRGLAVLGPVRTAIICTVEPFCTAVLAAVVLGQSLTALALAGGAMIAAAVVLLQSDARDPAVTQRGRHASSGPERDAV